MVKKSFTYKNKVVFSALLAINILCILIGIVLAHYIFITRQQAASFPENGGNMQKEILQRRYTELISSEGGINAYNEFKKQTDKISDFNIQHIHAHYFGESLYQMLGIDGASVCDSAYTYGCYHSFFGFAIQEHGLPVVPQLRSECEKKNSTNTHNCIHGIGHSVVYYLGDEKLIEALDICSKIATGDYLFHCLNGVFMEYNMHTINNPAGDARMVRPLGESYYAPCSSLSAKYQESCYHQLPQWWSAMLKEENTTQRLGQLCAGIQSSKGQEKCYYASGSLLLSKTNDDRAGTIAKCRVMPKAGILPCQKGYIESGMGDELFKKSFTISMCNDLPQDEKNSCRKIFEH